MYIIDPIADMLTRIRNAVANKSDAVEIPSSKTKLAIAQILLDEGFVTNFSKSDADGIPMIKITLKYGPNGEKVIQGLKRISKPGLRLYAKSEQLPKVLNGLGIAIISTDIGIVTDKEARSKKVGGEVLAYVW